LRAQSNKVLQELRRRIHDGVYRPAESLTEVILATEFGVSRNTVKNALLKLENESLIVMEENKRARVRWFSVEESMQCLAVRELLECFIIRESVPFLGPAELEELSIALEEMKKCLDVLDYIHCSQHNARFYDVIYRVCPIRPAVEMVKMIRNQLRRFSIRTVLIPGRGVSSFKEHSMIFDAVIRGEAEEAEKLMHDHMVNLRMVLRDNYELLR
jgi:DNA-binding GntR family transcriptional regulator